jgi:cytochrome b subunit of formate dehydrogenase
MSTCSECQKKVGFINWAKIINPCKFKCSSCKSILKFNSIGLKWVYVFLVIFIPLIVLQGYLIINRVSTFEIRSLILAVWFIPLYYAFYRLTINNIENKT